MYTIFDEEVGEYAKVEEPDHSLTYTYADYIKWKFIERLELIRGRIYELCSPTTKHQEITGRLYYELYGFLKGKTCKVFVSPFDIRLPVKNRKKDDEITTVVQPDICVVCDPAKIENRGVCGAPDLAIEVLSPSTSQKDIRLKHDIYEEAGVKEYWIISPTEPHVMVYLSGPDGKFTPPSIYTSSDKLSATAVPGFTIEVAEIFTY